jgi:hypothetical protein
VSNLEPCRIIAARIVRFHGMDLVKKIEAYGTRDGKPKAKIIIADCGELKPAERETKTKTAE